MDGKGVHVVAQSQPRPSIVEDLAQLQRRIGTMGTLGSQPGCWAITLILWLGDQ